MQIKMRCHACSIPVELTIEEFEERLPRSKAIAEHDKNNIVLLCEKCSLKALFPEVTS